MKNRLLFGLTAAVLPLLIASCATTEKAGTKSGSKAAASQETVPLANVIEKYNSNFEGVNGEGALWWWSDRGWKPNFVAQAAYNDGEQPDAECGKFYGKATSNNGDEAQCQFAYKDLAAAMQAGATYNYSFWAKIADDSAVKEGTLKLVVNAASEDWSDVESAQLTTPVVNLTDKWQKFTGSFPMNDPKGTIQMQFTGSAGINYCVDDVRVTIDPAFAGSIETNIVSLKDVLTSDKGFGHDLIVGGAMTVGEASDPLYMQLLFKHFNGVTLGNELKLDAMNGYHDGNRTPLGITTDTLNGKEIKVPVLDHSRADSLLDKVVAYNQKNPKNPIKVRGHVLVWHSQAPEWFFHKDYDMKKADASKEEMNERMEWYIKTMLTYYTDKSSETGKKYADCFYGWDVVNEAVSDGTGTYRSDTENSSWWRIYKSNEFIINAFKFANKYAPKTLGLYYNDYNEASPQKMKGIVQLLKDVKNAEGTRITAMGMQGHYNMDSPSITEFENAVREYCKVVDSVMITEFDLKASSSFNGTNFDDEYNKQAYRYKSFYDKLVELDKEKGVNVSGVIFWGVTDPYSWLQTFSGVGGGADGKQSQCPLLFDGKYKAKPAFYAFADPSKLEPAIKNITIVESDDFAYGTPYSFQAGNVNVEFSPIWKNGKVSVKANAKGKIGANDKIALFVDDGSGIKSVSDKASSATVLSIDTAAAGSVSTIKIDVRYETDKAISSFNDLLNNQATSSKFYAAALMKPYAVIKKGSPALSFDDATWNTANTVKIGVVSGLTQASGEAKVLWDEKALYVYATVKDSDINTDNMNAWEQDSIEVFIDENNAKKEAYEGDDKQYRIGCNNEPSFNGVKCKPVYLKSEARLVDGGYEIVASFAWTDVKPVSGMKIGFDLQINDADKSAKRLGTINWYDETGSGWSKPCVFGTVSLE